MPSGSGFPYEEAENKSTSNINLELFYSNLADNNSGLKEGKTDTQTTWQTYIHLLALCAWTRTINTFAKFLVHVLMH